MYVLNWLSFVHLLSLPNLQGIRFTMNQLEKHIHQSVTKYWNEYNQVYKCMAMFFKNLLHVTTSLHLP